MAQVIDERGSNRDARNEIQRGGRRASDTRDQREVVRAGDLDGESRVGNILKTFTPPSVSRNQPAQQQQQQESSTFQLRRNSRGGSSGSTSMPSVSADEVTQEAATRNPRRRMQSTQATPVTSGAPISPKSMQPSRMPEQPAVQENADGRRDQQSGKGRKSGKSKKAAEKPKLKTMSFNDIVSSASDSITEANAIRPEEVEYVAPSDIPFSYDQQAQVQNEEKIRKNRKKKRGLGTGLSKILSKSQKRDIRGQDLSDIMDAASRNYRSYLDKVGTARTEASISRNLKTRDALQKMNSQLSERRGEIVDIAKSLNDNADILTLEQMLDLGLDSDELGRLGLSRLLPPEVRYDGISEDSDIRDVDKPFAVYSRIDQKTENPLDALISMIDESMKDLISVERDEIDEESLTSFQDYLGNGVAPEEMETPVKRMERIWNSQESTQAAFLDPLRLFKEITKGETLESQGFSYVMASMDKETMNAIANVSRAYGGRDQGLSIMSSLRLAMHRGGISFDNFNKMKPKMINEVVQELCIDLVRSANDDKHPGLWNNLVTGMPYGRCRDDVGNVVFGGTRCFPFPYLPDLVLDEMMSIPGNPLRKYTREQIRAMEWDVAMNDIMPIVRENSTKEQFSAWKNGAYALMRLDGQNPNHWDIPAETEMTVAQMIEDSMDVTDPDIRRGVLVSVEDAKKSAKNAMRSYRHEPRARLAELEGSNEGGHSSSVRLETNMFNSMGNTLRGVSNMMISNSAIIGTNIAPNIVEAGRAAFESKVFNFVDHICESMTLKHVDMRDYTASAHVVAEVRSREGTEALDIWNALYHLDGLGWGMVNLYLQKGYKFTKSDYAKFVSDLRGMEGKIADLNIIISNATRFWNKLQMGDGLFAKNDAQNWIELTIREMGEFADRSIEEHIRSGSQEPHQMPSGILTNKQVEEAINVGGIEQFIRDMAKRSNAARDAFMFSGLNTFNSKNPWSRATERLFKANGITQFTFALLIDKHPVYGINKVLDTFPSNTVSYCLNTAPGGIGNLVEYVTGDAELGNKIANITGDRGYQAGTRSATWLEGFRRNLIYDVVHLGNKYAVKWVLYRVIGIFGGLGLPDDEDKRYLFSEYRIGGPEGVPIKYAWWLDDIMGISAPWAYADWLYNNGAYDRDGNLHEVDLETASKIFYEGCINQVSGVAIMDIMDMTRNMSSDMANLMMMMDDPDGYQRAFANDNTRPSDMGELFHAWIEHYLIANMIRSATPELFQELCPLNEGYIFRDPDSLAHTAGSEYAISSYQPKEEAMLSNDTRPVSYLQRIMRKDAQNNFLYALALDLTQIMERDNKTGYTYVEQPIATQTDAAALTFYRMFDFNTKTDDDFFDESGHVLGEEDMRIKLNERAIDLIDYMTTTWNTPEEAASDGFVISKTARRNAGEYCWYMYDCACEDFKRMQREESYKYLPKEDKQALKDAVEGAAWDYYIEGIYYRWLYSYDIPSEIPKYLRQETDYQTYYTHDDGTPATYAEWLQGGATENIYGFGNKSDELLPIAMPRKDGKGYNYETPAYWYTEGYTDTAAVADRLRGNVAPMGMHEGEELESLYFGGQPDGTLSIPEDSKHAPTISNREYIEPDLYSLPNPLRDLKAKEFKEEFGVDCHIPMKGGESDTTSGSSSDSSGSSADTYSSGRQKISLYPDDIYGSNSNNKGYTYLYSPRKYGSSRSRSYYSYSGGGGGGGGYSSSYNPKIYSSPRQVNGSRAAGMSTRQPYKASSTYLRPAFYTKGSREAYKRQDI